MDQTNITTAITFFIAIIAPFILKYAPASWKGQGMALVALLISLALGVVDLAATGQLAHLSWQTATITLVAYVGATQGIFALFKDPLQLSDPPPPSPKGI